MFRPIQPLALALVVVTASRCGGGGGSSGASAAPAVSLAFPDAVALTDAADLVLRGTAQDRSAIAKLAVNGTDVASFDGFATWSLDLALIQGDASLDLDASDARGRRNVGKLGTVRATALAMHAPSDVVVSGTSAFVVDAALHALVELDLKRGTSTIRSDPFHGAGADFSNASALDVDVARELAWIVDSSNSVVQVALKTGDRSPFSDGSRGTGPLPQAATAVVDDSAKTRVLVVDVLGKQILAADEATGNRTVFSDATHGSGVNFSFPSDAVLDTGRSRLLVADEGLVAIVTVSLANGDRKVLSDATTGSGTKLTSPTAVALSGDGKLAFVLDRGDGTIVSVNLASGDRELVSDGSKAGPPILDGTRNIAFASVDTDLVLIADDRTPELVGVVVKNGQRELIEPWRIGTGPALENPVGVALDATARRLFVADADNVKSIDLATGVRSEFSAAAGGSGPAFLEAGGIARDPAHDRLFVLDELQGILTLDPRTGARALLVDAVNLLSLQGLGFGLAFDTKAGQLYFTGETTQGEQRLFAVDVASGAVRVVADSTHGSGTAFGFVDSLSLTADGTTLLAGDDSNAAIFRVDVATGDRTVVASASDGLAPAITGVAGCAITADGSFALFAGTSPQGVLADSCLFALDLVNGGRSIVSSNFGSQHLGPFWAAELGVAFDADRNVVYVTDDDSVAIHAVDFNTGTRVVVSR